MGSREVMHGNFKQLITFVGLPRGGQHAIIHWILNQVKKPRCLCKQKRRYKDLVRIGSLEANNNLVISAFEGFSLEYIRNKIYEEPYLQSGNSVVMIQLRDFFNWIASLTKRLYDISPRILHTQRNIYATKMSHIWKSYAKEALGQTDIFSNKMFVNYNEWFSSREYRQRLCTELGGQYSESTLQRVAAPSRGSSFDKLRYQNKASDMLVDHRWVQMANDPIYVSVIEKSMDDEEFVAAFLSMYGETEAFQYFLKRFR